MPSVKTNLSSGGASPRVPLGDDRPASGKREKATALAPAKEFGGKPPAPYHGRNAVDALLPSLSKLDNFEAWP